MYHLLQIKKLKIVKLFLIKATMKKEAYRLSIYFFNFFSIFFYDLNNQLPFMMTNWKSCDISTKQYL